VKKNTLDNLVYICSIKYHLINSKTWRVVVNRTNPENLSHPPSKPVRFVEN